MALPPKIVCANSVGVLTVNVALASKVVVYPAEPLNSREPVPVLAKVVSAAMVRALATIRLPPLSIRRAPASVKVPVPSGPCVSVPETTVESAPRTSVPAEARRPPENVLLPALIVRIPEPSLSRAPVPAMTPVPSEPSV